MLAKLRRFRVGERFAVRGSQFTIDRHSKRKTMLCASHKIHSYYEFHPVAEPETIVEPMNRKN